MSQKERSARRLTQYDIARELGVSQSTVSQVLGNRAASTIPEETRQRVLEAARALGYVPDRVARSLRTGKTNIIAAVIPDITNPFYPALVRGIQDVAEEHAYHVATYNSDGDGGKERQLLEVIMQARADGVILAPFHLDRAALQPLLDRQTPVVLLAGPDEYPDLPVDNIGTDAVGSAQAATEYLIGRGHRRIALLTSDLAWAGRKRAEGYDRALKEQGLPIDDELVVWCKDFTEKGGFEGMQRCARLRPLPTAVFAASDQLALGALLAARELGIDVPGQVAIIGIDDISLARLVSPALTTIAQDQERQGRQAAQMLFERLNQSYQGPPRRIFMPYELIVRESA
jgi:LacI family transcriptional regulator